MQNQKKVLILGAGRIGAVIAYWLAESKDYEIIIASDKFVEIPTHIQITKIILLMDDAVALESLFNQNNFDAVISALPYFFNENIALLARKYGVNYFDLTEDIQTTKYIAALAQGSSKAFVPQCGLAPGFINIVANDLMQTFNSLEAVKLRAGALPQSSNNSLHYYFTWSTDGLINQYINRCPAVIEGQFMQLEALADLESIQIKGIFYEAFNTSGGIGTLAETYANKVTHLDYKALRYPGHCEKMRFLLQELKLKQNRPLLKMILENAVPTTLQDIVVIYIFVSGIKEGIFLEKNYSKIIYPNKIGSNYFTAIQLTTASGVCAVMDIVLNHPKKYQGFVRQETFNLNEVINNRFGVYFE